MAINFQTVYDMIREYGAQAKERLDALNKRRQQARDLLAENRADLAGLRYKVEAAKKADPALRCALPLNEPLDFHAPAPDLPPTATLIAADGSQIFPDRHNAILYGLINVGAIVMRLNSGETPLIYTDSQILFDNQLYTSSGGPITDGMLALQRDTAERSKLLDLAGEFGADGSPVVTFTDGPLELWGMKEGEEAGAYEDSLRKYLSILSRLQSRGVTTAGYIDKPGSDPVVRLLEIAAATPEDLQHLREFHPLLGVSDRWLLGDEANSLLKPGERSAVFGFQAKSEKDYKGLLALHFFYLNTSDSVGKPKIARVDIPRWVVDEPGRLDLLHAVLVQQCRLMGARPYPYLLHRAHETAVVSFDDKREVDQMLELEMRRSGGEVGEISGKQSAKDSSTSSTRRAY